MKVLHSNSNFLKVFIDCSFEKLHTSSYNLKSLCAQIRLAATANYSNINLSVTLLQSSSLVKKYLINKGGLNWENLH